MKAASAFPREVLLNDICMVWETFLVEKYIFNSKGRLLTKRLYRAARAATFFNVFFVGFFSMLNIKDEEKQF